jgi:hypothetical protein
MSCLRTGVDCENFSWYHSGEHVSSTGTCRGNAEPAKPCPKFARAPVPPERPSEGIVKIRSRTGSSLEIRIEG